MPVRFPYDAAVDADTLTIYARAKPYPHEADEACRRLLSEGWTHAIEVRAADGLVVRGAVELQAARYLGVRTVPVIRHDIDEPAAELAAVIAMREWRAEFLTLHRLSAPRSDRPSGAPDGLTPDVQRRAIEAARLGYGRKDQARAAGVALITLKGWLEKGAENKQPYAAFVQRLEAAAIEGGMQHLRKLERQTHGYWTPHEYVHEDPETGEVTRIQVPPKFVPPDPKTSMWLLDRVYGYGPSAAPGQRRRGAAFENAEAPRDGYLEFVDASPAQIDAWLKDYDPSTEASDDEDASE